MKIIRTTNEVLTEIKANRNCFDGRISVAEADWLIDQLEQKIEELSKCKIELSLKTNKHIEKYHRENMKNKKFEDIKLYGKSGNDIRPDRVTMKIEEFDYLITHNENLVKCLQWVLDWIDAVPPGTQLPSMPGFDRDYVDNIIKYGEE